MTERVAIVGLAVRFPGSGADLAAFWENVVQARDCAREVPPGRWALPPERVLHPEMPRPDSVPTSRGYYLEPFEPDLDGLAIDRNLVAELDPLFHLVLDVGNRATRTAKLEQVDRRRAGVIFGNICLPTEKTNAHSRRDSVHSLNRHPTGLPAGLLAKALGFGGTAFTLDAACASTLYAIKLAADELLSGRADLMLAGGASRPDCLYTQMGFAQLRALSPRGVCSPFSASADGLVVGEGAGLFVLKRATDAIKHGDRIYALLAGAGLSNDQNGNLLAPALEGQLRAMRAAYANAGWKPSDVDLIECHATGTPVGDAVEFNSLRELWEDEAFVPGQCPIGSVKSTVGHLLTGAGAAALTKVLLAMEHATKPPQANFATANTSIDYEASPFRVLNKAEPWSQRTLLTPRRGAVSGFGFGGVNAHLLFEEWRNQIDTPRLKPSEQLQGRFKAKAMAEAPEPIAIVGLAAHVGQCHTLREFQEAIFNGAEIKDAIEKLSVPLDRFRVPPKEIESMLPQQALMLTVATAALDDCQSKTTDEILLRSGAFIGLGLDFNATNFHLRWIGTQPELPPLTADRVMGALGSITASRIARTFSFGGPSFTLCSEETSVACAIRLAMDALTNGELDRAVVGGVELSSDPRVKAATKHSQTDAAAALVLKRFCDAERDGDQIYATLEINDPVTEGETPRYGIASIAVEAVASALSLHHRINPTPSGPQFWLADADEPRQATIAVRGMDGFTRGLLLKEHAQASNDPQPLGERSEAVFALEGDNVPELLDGLERLMKWLPSEGSIESLARNWLRRVPQDSRKKLAVAFVAHSSGELKGQIDSARNSLVAKADWPLPDPSRHDPRGTLRDRVFFNPYPLGRGGKLAFVFPGSGNHFPGMGRDLAAHWPDVLRRQQSENALLRQQYAPQLFWGEEIPPEATPRDFLFGQVTFGTLAADLLTLLGITPDAMIGQSLGESAGLFGTRIWTSRDEMYRRLQASTLFTTDLGPPYNSARTFFNLASEPFEWISGIIAASADDVRAHLRPALKAYLLIVTGPVECVIGGASDDVMKLSAAVHKPFLKLNGVTLAHCDAGEPVKEAYRELHRLPVESTSLRVYSGAWSKPYAPTEQNCADSITAGLLNTIDVPLLIEAAYRDGIRAFVEVGPGGSTTRMISSILGDRPHLARTIAAPRQDSVSQVLRLVARLIAERFPVSLQALYAAESKPAKASGKVLVIPVRQLIVADEPEIVEQDSGAMPTALPVNVEEVVSHLPTQSRGHGTRDNTRDLQAFIIAAAATSNAAAEAHSRFLEVQDALTRTAFEAVQLQTHLLQRMLKTSEVSLGTSDVAAMSPTPQVPRSLSLAQCQTFATGRIGDVLGPLFAEADSFPTRVRLPDGPLMLVDRILAIDGEPRSMTSGRVITDHTVHKDRWYLDAGRCPTSVTVESGQADLFLSGFLGIDFETRGLAVYRLLDAVVTFHRELPRIGETIVYDIRIDSFFRQADSWLFRFRFEGTINGKPMLSMASGVAGFFTQAALDAGQGIIHTKLDRQPQPGKVVDFVPLVPQSETSLDETAVEALRQGNFAKAFGSDFAVVSKLKKPMPLPGGMLKLVDRVTNLLPTGGRCGLGFIRAEYDLRPKEWFIECHFVDDKVMPGTLMYECCLHTLRILLHRFGWIGEAGTICEPVPGIASKLKCRGQVLETTKTVTYEVSVKEIGYGPEPYAIADALMFADGKPIVEISNMSLRMGLTKREIETLWQPSPGVATPGLSRTYEKDRILAYSNGKPSEGFGEPYRIFDEGRIIARLPGPPFQFVDRIASVTGEPFEMKAGAACVAEYKVPPEEWYFQANRSPLMPFSVLLEIALQPCGWLAAYCGSALTSPVDLSFRNLGGQAKQLRAVTPGTGLLTTRVKLTKVSSSVGMVIQHYDLQVSCSAGVVYEGNTYFGFFAKEALQNQVGMPTAKVPFLTEEQKAIAEPETLPHDAPFPEPMLRMVDRIDGWLPRGGRAGLGLVQGRITVNPEFWFFKAHFFQDPVWPGSLGLESFLQLLKYAAWKKWTVPPRDGWQTVALNSPHSWNYRGQVLPTDREVIVVLEVTAEDRERRTLKADGYLTVDGRIIYHMTDFTLE